VAEIDRLLDVMARLRDPEDGCPWDREQDFASIAPYTIEEAYEVADAIARRDWEDLRDELGDLLLQVVYHAQMARELGHFAFDDVARSIADKLVRRHPHVFGDAGDAAAPHGPDPLDDVPLALPALRRAAKIQARAERSGASDDEPLLESDGLASWVAAHDEPDLAAGDAAERRARIGDALVALVALARRLGVDPERALAERTRAFEERVRGRTRR